METTNTPAIARNASITGTDAFGRTVTGTVAGFNYCFDRFESYNVRATDGVMFWDTVVYPDRVAVAAPAKARRRRSVALAA